MGVVFEGVELFSSDTLFISRKRIPANQMVAHAGQIKFDY